MLNKKRGFHILTNDSRAFVRRGAGALLAIMTMAANLQTAWGETLSPALREAYSRPAAIPFPVSNPYTLEKAALGKALFFEPRLSGAENMTCSSCHNPSFGWQTRNKTAVGSQNTHLPRRAPTILDTAWLQSFFWDGRAPSAEEQAKSPIQNPFEMNLPLDQAVARLNAIPGYKTRFKRIFPEQGVTAEALVAALATYERTVVSSYAPFDAWVDGDETAVSEPAKRGFALFTTKGHCSGCHSGWSFTDNAFHDIGTSTVDVGRGAVAPGDPFAPFAFKTPSLRDAAQRSPYMHDGQYATLEEVVLHYGKGGIARPSRSPMMQPITLTTNEVADIVAFLETLTGSKQVVTLPVLPN